jgi:hypothetical protein
LSSGSLFVRQVFPFNKLGRAERNEVERSRARERLDVQEWQEGRSRCLVVSSSSSFKSLCSVFLSFLPSDCVVNLRPCLIGVAAFLCAGQRAPRTSSYPDSWGETQRPLCRSCMTAATRESVPSNRRLSLRFTTSTYGQDSPDLKYCSEVHHAFKDGNQTVGSGLMVCNGKGSTHSLVRFGALLSRLSV